ncbi:MAG: carbohydrate ABC transporter permease, partial [Micromonosporaceae bacterium]
MTTTTAQPSATQAADVEAAATGAPRRGALSRVLGRTGGLAVQGFLILVALFWLMPSFGLFIASLRTSQDTAASGWWTVFTTPAQLTVDNYTKLLEDPFIVESLWNTVFISVPATVLVVLISAGAAYAFAWMEFPGRDWLFLIVVALIVVPIQMGLIPNAQIFRALGIFGTVSAAVLFHVAFGLPFAIFLLRNFFIGIPRDLLEAA